MYWRHQRCGHLFSCCSLSPMVEYKEIQHASIASPNFRLQRAADTLEDILQCFKRCSVNVKGAKNQSTKTCSESVTTNLPVLSEPERSMYVLWTCKGWVSAEHGAQMTEGWRPVSQRRSAMSCSQFNTPTAHKTVIAAINSNRVMSMVRMLCVCPP